MTFAQVLALIQQWIVQNGNNEITADVLRPILEAMLEQPNLLIGDLGALETTDQTDLVSAINSIVAQAFITTNYTLLNQYNQSSTTGDTQENLLQPDFGAAVFTVDDMQAGSSYSGEIYLEIDNNHTGTAKIIDLFGIGIFSATSAIPQIKGRLTFDIDFYNQAGNIITYRVSYGFVSPGLQFYGSEESTIDNTANRDIELTVNGDASDNIYVNKAKIKRENLKGIL